MIRINNLLKTAPGLGLCCVIAALIIAITNFIQQPDKITFSARPSTPLSYMDILNLIGNPTILVKLLNVEIK